MKYRVEFELVESYYDGIWNDYVYDSGSTWIYANSYLSACIEAEKYIKASYSVRANTEIMYELFEECED